MTQGSFATQVCGKAEVTLPSIAPAVAEGKVRMSQLSEARQVQLIALLTEGMSILKCKRLWRLLCLFFHGVDLASYGSGT